MTAMVETFRSDETGAAAIGYRRVAAGFPCATVAVVNGPGTRSNTGFASIKYSLN
jgi:pilus assembly protein Flp/PilA